MRQRPTVDYGNSFDDFNIDKKLSMARMLEHYHVITYIINIKIQHSTIHSALKLEKKCNFKSTKTHYLHFQKWQKINFCSRKKFKIAFLVVLNFFLMQKLIFFANFENANNVFLYL